MAENCFKLNIYFLKKTPAIWNCCITVFLLVSLYIHVQILAHLLVQFTNIKNYVQMATAIICDVMIFFFNYSTHVTPISVLPFPNLYRTQQQSLHYFLIDSFFTALINFAFAWNYFYTSSRFDQNFSSNANLNLLHPPVKWYNFSLPS